jgi:ParB-like chromosome segregation protein Spo0J
MAEQQSLIAPGLGAMMVPIDSVIPHPQNSNKHDRENIEKIKASLLSNRQYSPIVVQASTAFICKGNGTWMAAKELGWKHIAATAMDCEDEEALQILEVDNYTSADPKYDEEQRRKNWQVIAQYQQDVAAGRRSRKLAKADQPELGLLVADESGRLEGLREVDAKPSQAAYGEPEADFVRRSEAAKEEGNGDSSAGVEEATMAKAMGFREVILMYKSDDYARSLQLLDRARKQIPELKSNSAVVLAALEAFIDLPLVMPASPPAEESDWQGL